MVSEEILSGLCLLLNIDRARVVRRGVDLQPGGILFVDPAWIGARHDLETGGYKPLIIDLGKQRVAFAMRRQEAEPWMDTPVLTVKEVERGEYCG